MLPAIVGNLKVQLRVNYVQRVSTEVHVPGALGSQACQVSQFSRDNPDF